MGEDLVGVRGWELAGLLELGAQLRRGGGQELADLLGGLAGVVAALRLAGGVAGGSDVLTAMPSLSPSQLTLALRAAGVLGQKSQLVGVTRLYRLGAASLMKYTYAKRILGQPPRRRWPVKARSRLSALGVAQVDGL
jgi:hypothetical protein